MRRIRELDDPRRRILIQALSMGLFSAGVPASLAWAQAFGSRPAKLPPGQSIYRITGQATVNDKAADLTTQINPGDTVKTTQGSEVVFVVGTNAMIARGGSTIVIEKDDSGTSAIMKGLRMLTGAILSVSRTTPMQVRTSTGTIGIRGTGFYVEAEQDQTYFCTCYGTTEVASNADPENKETITAQHHDRPVYILANAPQGKNIRNAPFINHTDQELALIETLVGRTPPFVFPKDAYSAPRRTY